MELSEFTKTFLKIIREGSMEEFPYQLFEKPCQIFALYNSETKYLLLLTKHEPIDDMAIIFSEVSSEEEAKEFIDSKILSDQYWMKKNIAVQLASKLFDILKTIEKRFSISGCVSLGRIVPRIEGKSDLKCNDGMLLFSVDIAVETPDDLFKHSYFSLRSTKNPYLEQETIEIKTSEVKQSIPEIIREPSYFATLWYPPFIFEDEPMSLRLKSVLEITYLSQKIIFSNASSVFIKSPFASFESSFKKEATSFFNEIMATAQILGINACAVAERDIISVTFHDSLENISSRWNQNFATVRSLITDDFSTNSVYHLERFCPFILLKKSQIKRVIEKAEKIMTNRNVKEYLLSLLDANTHYLTDQFKTSFLLTWIVLEKYIDELWLDALNTQQLSEKRINKLQSMLWTTDDKLEALNLMNVLKNEHYFEVIRLKKIRNSIVHNGRSVTGKESEECLRFVLDLVREYIRQKCFIEI